MAGARLSSQNLPRSRANSVGNGFIPTLFNELHKLARHASRRTLRLLSKPVAPIFAKQDDYRGCGTRCQVASREIPGKGLTIPDTLGFKLRVRRVAFVTIAFADCNALAWF